jgi:hypothetical protein
MAQNTLFLGPKQVKTLYTYKNTTTTQQKQLKKPKTTQNPSPPWAMA